MSLTETSCELQLEFYQHATTQWPLVLEAKGWQDKYRLLMLLGKAMPALEPAFKPESAKVDGCETEAWLLLMQGANWQQATLVTTFNPTEPCWFSFETEPRVIKGVVALLLCELQGQVPTAAWAFALETRLNQLNVAQGISPSRSNGLHAVIRKITAALPK